MVDQIDTEIERDGGTVSPRIFVSYTRADIEPAKSLIALLEGNGFDVWWDDLLDGGDTYLPTTEAALESAACVVVLWSQRSVNSNWVRDEAQSGRERGCLVPLSLDGTMAPLGFRQIQLIDISNWKGDLQAGEASKILAAVRNQIARSGRADPDASTSQLARPGAALVDPPKARISRRAMIVGGVGLAGGAAVLGGWQLGLIGPARSGTMSMAVLRFANLTGDEDQAWFSDGLSNELRQSLSRNPLLRVSAPTSSTALAGEDDFAVGRALGVRDILRGSVQRVNDTVRIFSELVQLEDGLVRWSESYDRNFKDVLAVQSEIADTVAFALVTQVASEAEARRTLKQQETVGGTSDIKAYEAYLQGMAFINISSGEESDRAALERFNAALAIDPAYAAAQAMRATAYSAIANATSDAAEVDRLFANSIAAARQAIELEPRLAQGHSALAFALSYGKLDIAGAYPHYKKAQELAPGDSSVLGNTALFYAYGDRHALATKMIENVLKLDPRNARVFRTAGFIALLGRDYKATITRMEEALALNPKLASANYAIATARYMQGDAAAAKTAIAAETVPLFQQTILAIVDAKLGDRAAARTSLEAIVKEYGDASLYQQAQIHAQWGDSAQALALLRRALEEGDPGMLWAPNDPLLDPVRGEPSLDQLLLPLTS